jgi:hypothetical protein
MLSPQVASVAASALGHRGHQPEPAPPIGCSLEHGETLRLVDLRLLPPGTELVVATRNSRYRLALLDDGWNALVQGGRHLQETTTAHVEGCTLSGSLLKRGWITVGCCLELSICGRRIVTSYLQSISVNLNAAAV